MKALSPHLALHTHHLGPPLSLTPDRVARSVPPPDRANGRPLRRSAGRFHEGSRSNSHNHLYGGRLWWPSWVAIVGRWARSTSLCRSPWTAGPRRDIFPHRAKHVGLFVVRVDPGGYRATSSLLAMAANSTREPALIFRITGPRFTSTVTSLMPSSKPASLFNKPRTTAAPRQRAPSLRCVPRHF